MHTVFALLCFVVVIHWLFFPYPSGLLHWHCGNLTIAPVPAKQPWWIWINTSCEFIMNDCITTTKQSTIKPCAYFLGYTVCQCTILCNAFRCEYITEWRHHDIMMTSPNGNMFRVTGPLWGESTGPRWIPSQRPITRSFAVFFDLRLNKGFSKQSIRLWFKTPSRSLWRHCNDGNDFRFTGILWNGSTGVLMFSSLLTQTSCW